MRLRRQICEGIDWRHGAPKSIPHCFSEAHWRVDLGPVGLTFYLCSTCHAMAELDFAEKAVPRHTAYSAAGFNRAPGHEAANRRHDEQFTDACKVPGSLFSQLTLFPL